MELKTQSLPGIGGLLVEITADHLEPATPASSSV
jgi:hypothetical protein